MSYVETDYEGALIELFRDTLGYRYVYGPDVTRDYSDPLYKEELEAGLARVNPSLPQAALDEALIKLRNLEAGSPVKKNEQFMEYLQNGISVNYFDRSGRSENDSGQRSALVSLVDYKNVERNSFVIGNQWTVFENSEKRPDMVVFLNGLPVVVIELKSPSREETDASEGYSQLRNYMHQIPSLFFYNAFLAISDQAISKAGTITAGEDRFMEWKTKDGSYENTQYAQFDTFFEGIFAKARLLDIIRNFICFSGEKKILGAYHQYFAVKKAIESTVMATDRDGRGGVFGRGSSARVHQPLPGRRILRGVGPAPAWLPPEHSHPFARNTAPADSLRLLPPGDSGPRPEEPLCRGAL
jgi:type I restriction enzyme R subunit